MSSFIRNTLNDQVRFEIYAESEFKKADVDGSGTLTLPELTDTIKRLYKYFKLEVPSDGDIEKLFNDSDSIAKDGTLDFKEFLGIAKTLLENRLTSALNLEAEVKARKAMEAKKAEEAAQNSVTDK